MVVYSVNEYTGIKFGINKKEYWTSKSERTYGEIWWGYNFHGSIDVGWCRIYTYIYIYTWGTPGTPFLVQIHKSCLFIVFDGFHVQDRKFTPFPIAERFFTPFWLNCVQITFTLRSNCVQITFNYVQVAQKLRTISYNVIVWKRFMKSRPGQQFLSNFPIVYFFSSGQEKVSWGCPRYINTYIYIYIIKYDWVYLKIGCVTP